MGQLWLHSLVIFIVLFLRNIQAQRTGKAFFTYFSFFRTPRPGSSVFWSFYDFAHCAWHWGRKGKGSWRRTATALLTLTLSSSVRTGWNGSWFYSQRLLGLRFQSFSSSQTLFIWHLTKRFSFLESLPLARIFKKNLQLEDIHFVDVIDKCKPYVAGLARLNFSDGKIKLMVNFIMMNFLHV